MSSWGRQVALALQPEAPLSSWPPGSWGAAQPSNEAPGGGVLSGAGMGGGRSTIQIINSFKSLPGFTAKRLPSAPETPGGSLQAPPAWLTSVPAREDDPQEIANVIRPVLGSLERYAGDKTFKKNKNKKK